MTNFMKHTSASYDLSTDRKKKREDEEERRQWRYEERRGKKPVLI